MKALQLEKKKPGNLLFGVDMMTILRETSGSWVSIPHLHQFWVALTHLACFFQWIGQKSYPVWNASFFYTLSRYLQSHSLWLKWQSIHWKFFPKIFDLFSLLPEQLNQLECSLPFIPLSSGSCCRYTFLSMARDCKSFHILLPANNLVYLDLLSLPS